MKDIINHAIARQAYVDQSQSMNLFMPTNDANKLTSALLYGWKNGLKTGMYYLRTLPATSAQKFSIDANKLDANKLDANKLDANKLDANKLDANKLDANKLDANKLDANKLGANKLEANKLEAKNVNISKPKPKIFEAEEVCTNCSS